MTSKKGLHCIFLQTLGAIFEIKQRWAPFLPGLSGILPEFSTKQNFWGCVCTPTPYNTEWFQPTLPNFSLTLSRFGGCL